jgi:hypothetical protein
MAARDDATAVKAAQAWPIEGLIKDDLCVGLATLLVHMVDKRSINTKLKLTASLKQTKAQHIQRRSRTWLRSELNGLPTFPADALSRSIPTVTTPQLDS